MLSQRIANLVFVTIVFVACGYFAWVAEGFVTSGLLASSGLPSKFFPQLTLAMTGVAALVVGYFYFARGEAGGDANEKVFEDTTEARQGILMLCVAVVCYFTWSWFGFYPMAFLLGPLSLAAMGIRAPLIYLVVWVLTAAVTAIFTYGLGIQLV